MSTPHPISGYVLAGGRTRRMGRDKALIPLAGNPLVEHAVTKLRRICAEVSISAANPSLAISLRWSPTFTPTAAPSAASRPRSPLGL